MNRRLHRWCYRAAHAAATFVARVTILAIIVLLVYALIQQARK